MTTPTLRDAILASQAVCERITEQYGEVACGVDFAVLLQAINAALAAQPELPEPLCVAIIQAGRITGQFKDEKEALDAIEAAACEGQVVAGDLVIEEIYTAEPLQQAKPVSGESVLVEGTAYDIPMPVAAELLRLNIELKQAQAKREPMSDTDLARLFREIYGATRFGESERLLARAIEAHHGIGDKA